MTAAVVGLVVDVGLRGGPVGIGAFLAITAVTVGLMVLVADRTAERWLWATLAVLAAAGLVLRTSPWIVTLDWVAALGFLGLASSTSRSHPILGSSLPRLAWRSGAPPMLGVILGPTELLEATSTIRQRPADTAGDPSTFRRTAPAVVRGLLIAAPIVFVLGTLLASADGVFASFFDVPTPESEDLVSHLALIGLGAAGLASLTRWSREPIEPSTATNRPLGPVETMVVLGGLAILYALFAVARVVASTGGDERIQETTGLTYAEYARTGFFQLLWCAAITIVVLLGLRALSKPGSGHQQVAVRTISAVTCALTLVVVATAISRLGLYEDAYGLTMLRLACTTFAWVLGAAFLLLGIRLLQTSARDWLPASYVAVVVLALGWWNISNPEVKVVDTNLDRAAATGKLDIDYLDTMSDDAMPAILRGLDRVPVAIADEVRVRLCGRPPSVDDPYGAYDDRSGSHVDVDEDGIVRVPGGWTRFNVSRQAAVDVVQRCADDAAG